MTTIEELFDVNQRELPLLRPIARNIKSLRLIIEEDRVQGKPNAMKYLAYIYYMTSKLHFMDYHIDSREGKIRDIIGLEPDWKPSASVRLALEEFTDIEKSTTERMLMALKKVQWQFIGVFERLSSRVDSQLERANQLDENGVITDPIILSQQKIVLTELEEMFGKVSKMTVELARQLEEVKKYEMAYVKEAKSDKMLKATTANKWEDE